VPAPLDARVSLRFSLKVCLFGSVDSNFCAFLSKPFTRPCHRRFYPFDVRIGNNNS
jgi:hypothetical protein